MASYKVLKEFKDKETGQIFSAGSSYETDNKDRVSVLSEGEYIEVENNGGTDSEGALKHTGGGWYELPNGEKVKGKEEAQAALEELQKSGE